MSPRNRRWLDRWLRLALLGAAFFSPTPAVAVGFLALWTGVLMAPALRSAWRRGAAMRAGGSATMSPGDELIIGSDPARQPVRITDRQLAAHALVVGASGSGKSTTLLTLLQARVARGDPVIAIDLKGSPAFADILRTQARAAGRELAVFSLDGGRHWNPLAHGGPTALKDKLISSERFTEPHYQRAAERYVQSALQVLAAQHPGQETTLPELIGLMEPRRLARAIEQVPAPLRERVSEYLDGLGREGARDIRGIGTRLALLNESDTGPWLTPGRPSETIDLAGALRGGDVVLFSLNSSVYGKLAAQLGALAVQNLVSASGERLAAGGSRRPAVIALDEFSALGADNVLALLARGRESGMSVLLATQELADLERAGRGFTDQVLGITGMKIAHRQDVPASALLFAQMAGTHQVWEQTEVVRAPFSAPRAARGSRRQVERYLVHPNEIKTLPTGQAVILAKLPRSEIIRVRVRPPDRPAARATPDAPAARATPDARAARATPDARAARATPDAPAARATPDARAARATPDAEPGGSSFAPGPGRPRPARRPLQPPRRPPRPPRPPRRRDDSNRDDR